MKQISQYKFAQIYNIENPLHIVEIGKELTLTDDLYIIRSTYRKRNYSYREDGSAGLEWEYKPCWKLMSSTYNQDRVDADEYQMCIMAWEGHRLYNFRRDAWRIYGPENSARYINTNAVFDWLYYTINPITLHHANGNLKRGFSNHLIKRLNGFGKESPITMRMLKTLVVDIRVGKVTEFLISPTTDTTIDKVKAYLLNNGELWQCPITKEILPRSHMTWMRISGSSTYVTYGVSLSDHGYHTDTASGEWLLEGEVMIEGTCYQANDVDIMTCEGCNKKCVEIETRDGQCVDCLGQNYQVNNYTLKVEEALGFDRRGKTKSEPYLGVELEFQVDKHKQGRLYTGDKLQDHALMKEDGSVSNGFEIVTRPSGYFTHINKLGSFLDDLPEYIHPHQSCGMHVHISRTAFTWLGAGKFTEFFNRVDNKKFIKAIAGRGTTQYQEQSENMDIKSPYNVIARDRGVPRYNFVNLNNDKTIELRIFATPANKLELEIRMQFVKAMIEYCKPAQHTVSLKEQTSYVSFKQWLNNVQDDTFKKLNKFIQESQLCV